MFGVVPKTIWSKTNPADANNLIDLAARCLLIEDGNRLILIDTGMGNKQSEKFFSYYSMWGDHSLDASLAKFGFHRDDITDVFLTHLHFDHSGGAVNWNKDHTGYETAFKNAKYWTNENHWDWAINPNQREKASFLKENLLPIQEAGQLNFLPLPTEGSVITTDLGFSVYCVDGHTEKMMIPLIPYQGRTIAFTADLLPTAGHLPLPYVMGYDTRPLLTMGEKDTFLNWAVQENYLLFMEHDAHNPIISVKNTDKGVRLDEIYQAEELLIR